MADYSAARAVLEEDQQKLLRQLTDLGATPDGELRKDLDFGEGFADAAAITAERTEVLGLIDTLKRHLDAVDAALERIEEGSYGECRNCGTKISPERMEARPISTKCVSCKAARR